MATVQNTRWGLPDLVGLTVAASAVVVLPGFPDPFNIPKLVILVSIALALLPIAAWRIYLAWTSNQLNTALKIAVSACSLFMGWACISALLAAGQLSAKTFGWLGRNDGLLTWLAVGSLFLTACLFTRPQVARVITWVMGGATVVLVTALIQATGVTILPGTGNQVSATMGNSNFASGYFAILLPLLLGCALSPTTPRVVRTWAGILVVADIAALVANTDDQGRVAAVISLACFFLIWLIAARGMSYRPARITFITVVAAVTAGVVLTVVKVGPLWSVVSNLSFTTRLGWWQATTPMTQDMPLLGTGPGQLAFYIGEYRSSAIDGLQTIPSAVHNIALQVLATLGIPGFVLWMTVFLLPLFMVVMLVRHAPTTQPMLIASVTAALIAYLAQGFVSIDMIPLITIGWVLAALTLSLSHEQQGTRNQSPTSATDPPSLTPTVAVALSILVGLASFGATMFHANTVKRSLTSIATINQLTHVLTDPQTPCGARMRVIETATSQPLPAEALRAIVTATNIEPRCPGLSSIKSAAALQLGDVDTAKKAAIDAITYDPVNEALYFNAAELYVQLGDMEGANQVLESLQSMRESR